MQPPIASTDLISLTVGALSRLMAGHEMAAASGQVRPCECDVCVCIRDVRAAYAAQCHDPETNCRIPLRQWLSPEQVTQYEARGAFEVVGSKTGKRYRIEGRRQQNVCESTGRAAVSAACASCPRAVSLQATSCCARKSPLGRTRNA
jgi:hypothetical protein